MCLEIHQPCVRNLVRKSSRGLARVCPRRAGRAGRRRRRRHRCWAVGAAAIKRRGCAASSASPAAALARRRACAAAALALACRRRRARARTRARGEDLLHVLRAMKSWWWVLRCEQNITRVSPAKLARREQNMTHGLRAMKSWRKSHALACGCAPAQVVASGGAGEPAHGSAPPAQHRLQLSVGGVVCDAAGLDVPPPPLLRRLPQPMRRRHQDDDVRFEAALQRQKDSRGSAQPLNRREAFRAVWREGPWGSVADADAAEQRFSERLSYYRTRRRAPPEAWRRPDSCLAEALAAPAVMGRPRVGEDDVRFEAALQRQKDSRGSAQPLNRREAFRAVWRDRRWGSDAAADKAYSRFAQRLSRYRAGHAAPPEAWLRPGSCGGAECAGRKRRSQAVGPLLLRPGPAGPGQDVRAAGVLGRTAAAQHRDSAWLHRLGTTDSTPTMAQQHTRCGRPVKCPVAWEPDWLPAAHPSIHPSRDT
jgi:hypothetical protein